MKKHLISALLIGAMVVPAFVACDNKGLDDLTRRVEVLEGAWHQTQKDLQNAVVTGLTITSANQAARPSSSTPRAVAAPPFPSRRRPMRSSSR